MLLFIVTVRPHKIVIVRKFALECHLDLVSSFHTYENGCEGKALNADTVEF